MGSIVKSIFGGGDAPKAYNPNEDPVYVARQQDLDRTREETRAAQVEIATKQDDAKKRTEVEQRDLAAKSSARARARRFGGVRSLLSDQRLNPEVGLGGPQSTLG